MICGSTLGAFGHLWLPFSGELVTLGSRVEFWWPPGPQGSILGDFGDPGGRFLVASGSPRRILGDPKGGFLVTLGTPGVGFWVSRVHLG